MPSWLTIELVLFAGQLYLSSYADYKNTCALLGLSTNSMSQIVDADGFIRQDLQGRRGGASGLSQSPVSFMQSLMSTVRRNGEAINKTHMGRVLKGQLLQEGDFQATI